MFNNCIKEPKCDSEGNPYPEQFNVKFGSDYETKMPNVELYPNGDSTPVDNFNWSDLEGYIPSNSFITGVFQPKIWFVNKKYGIKLEFLSVLVHKKKTTSRPTGFALFSSDVKASGPVSSEPETVEALKASSADENSDSLISFRCY